jgi:hypothetical protein
MSNVNHGYGNLDNTTNPVYLKYTSQNDLRKATADGMPEKITNANDEYVLNELSIKQRGRNISVLSIK